MTTRLKQFTKSEDERNHLSIENRFKDSSRKSYKIHD